MASTVAAMKGSASRINGMGSLLRSLRALVARVDRYGQHRASTADERRWANILADGLERAYCTASTPTALASLAAVERRAALSAKTPGPESRGDHLTTGC